MKKNGPPTCLEVPKFEAPGENQNLFPATHPGLQTSSGKTTNHPFHLHRRILLVQQHERCSLRRWCKGNPKQKTTGVQRDRRKPRVLGFEPRSSKLTEAPNPWLYCDFLSPTGETARWKATPGVGPPTFCCYILSGDMEQSKEFSMTQIAHRKLTIKVEMQKFHGSSLSLNTLPS